MKRKFTFYGVLAFGVFSYAQSPITLTLTDFPTPTSPFNILEIYPSISASGGNDKNWDYSGATIGATSTNVYEMETLPFYTNAGIDIYSFASKNFNANFSYSIFNEFDLNINGFDDKGINIPAQAYSLSSITGNNNDSLIFPEQNYLLSQPRKILKFPLTMSSSWTSSCPKVANFNLKIASFGLNNTPAQHKYTVQRTDTIVGWGKLSVYTDGGPSIAYDVLMDRYQQYAIDSFFVAGSPAPQALMDAMGVSQGQSTNVGNGYNFYRSGSLNYLLRLYYGSDDTYTNLLNAFINTDNLQTLGVEENHKISYQTLIFPNPITEHSISIQLLGKKVNNPEISLFDLNGNLIQTEILTENSLDSFSIKLNNSFSRGSYLLQIKDENKNLIINENIIVN